MIRIMYHFIFGVEIKKQVFRKKIPNKKRDFLQKKNDFLPKTI